MAKILVVDDVEMDRELVRTLLEADLGLTVETAANGREALDRIEASPPDIVLTDLFMPELDGLGLIAELRRTMPHIPAIIMTSQGSEDLAAQALAAGAASYVPKSALAHDLLPNVSQILAVASQERDRMMLERSIVETESVFELDNTTSLVPPLVKHLQGWITRLGIGDEGDAMQVGVALQEALTNAIHHGNLEVDSSLREPDLSVYHDAIRERACCAPYCQRRVRVRCRFSRTEARFVITDQGPGFDPDALPDPRDPTNLGKVSGRGVLLMRSFMDDVAFNETGNEVTLVKRACRD